MSEMKNRNLICSKLLRPSVISEKQIIFKRIFKKVKAEKQNKTKQMKVRMSCRCPGLRLPLLQHLPC